MDTLGCDTFLSQRVHYIVNGAWFVALAMFLASWVG